VNSQEFGETLTALLSRRDLPEQAMRAMVAGLIGGQIAEPEAAALLIALRMKGETAAELAAAALVLREHMSRWDPGRDGVLDTCGTGGDGTGTFNISTATALVVAGAGVPVVKHGNRSVSSRSGSADVLRALGVQIETDAAFARRCLERAGLAFCFAPHYHPAMKNVAALRRRLGVPTLFNWLGPLANPAGASYQLLGVGRRDLLDLIAGALARLGTRRALVVCSHDGLDEVSLSAPTEVREVRGGTIVAQEWTHKDFGLEPSPLSGLRAESVEDSAKMIGDVLRGVEGPALRVVLANAAAALLAAECVGGLGEGVARAREAVTTGRALMVLEQLRAMSEDTLPDRPA